MTDRVCLGGLVMVEFGLVAGLHALGRVEGFAIDWSDPRRWLAVNPFEDVVGAVILVITFGLAYWLLLSTVAVLLATASGRPGLTRRVHRMTLPPIRRLANRAVALTIAASAVAAPIVPVSADEGSLIVEVGPDGGFLPPGTRSSGEVPGDEQGDVVLPPHLGSADRSSRPPDNVPTVPDELLDGTVAHTVVVRRGDHMWSMAEQHLTRITGRTDLAEHEIARYWVRVITENRNRIRSGDPDLIYPGETLVLPPA